MPAPVVVVGAGIAGLSFALGLRTKRDVIVLEASDRAGGLIRTDHDEGYTCEWAANGFLFDGDFTKGPGRVLKDLGLENEIVTSSDATRKRYLIHRGALTPLPTGPIAFFRSPLLTAGAKLRVFREPWVKTPPPADGNESVHAFLARRFGIGIADAFADSIVSGVFAGDAKALTMRGAFPRATDAEAAAGSVIKGMKSGGKPGKLTSFRGGMQTLIDRMAGDLGSSLRLNSEVSAIEPHENGVTVRVNGESIEASDVFLATPPGRTAALIAPIDQESARDLRTIRSARVAVLVTGFRAEQVRTPVDGFGFLVPRSEKMRILGSLWTSSIFPGTAPEGRVLFRTMIGGMHDPKALTLPGRALLPIALRELHDVMGIDGDPEFMKVFKNDPGIPQYEAGHEEIVKRVASRIGPRVSMIGNGVDGVAVAKLLMLYERGLSFQGQAGTRAGVAG